MKEFKIKLYSFDELSESAKSKVCDKERENPYNFGYLSQEDDATERYDTLNHFCDVFGISYEIDYDHDHRFISWNFKDVDMNGYEWCADDIKGKYLLRYLNRYYYQIRSPKYFSVWYTDENGKRDYKCRHSKIHYTEGNCPFTGMCYDEDILEKIFKWYEKPNWNISLKDLFEDCFDTFMGYWEKEDDYRMSDEHIGEMIMANWGDKLFYSNGEEFEGDLDELETLQSLSDEE